MAPLDVAVVRHELRNPERKLDLRYFCLISDYDGTLAHDGRVTASTIEALKRVKASGRKLVLATGRELPELLRVFPETAMFDLAVVENGAMLFHPASGEKKLLAQAPPAGFVEELRRRGVSPLSVGESIVATWHPHENTVLQVIRDMGLEMQVIFNKDAVMILPSGANKGTGVRAALDELGLSTHNALGVGDAENDHAFLGICECSVAVGNALPALKERADVVTAATHGEGVEEIIEKLLADDLRSLQPRLKRHEILLGHHEESGEEFCIGPYGTRVAVAGPSGGGKSTVVTAIVERLIQKQYQVCVIDPEGDYDDIEQFVTLGAADRIPGISEILEVLKNAGSSISINMLGVPLADRPNYFVGLLPRLQELRARTGRPHWIVIDEAHHLLPSELDSASLSIPSSLGSFALITVHPKSVSKLLMEAVNTVVAIGPDPGAVIEEVNLGAGKSWALPNLAAGDAKPEIKSGEMLVWQAPESNAPLRVMLEPAKAELRRHKRKYAEGELGEDKSFYFRGPRGKLNLRAQNLNIFAQIAEGVDDETWAHHLKRQDYSAWLREAVKDDSVADEIAMIEKNTALKAGESRAQILETIRKHYTGTA